MQWTDTEDLITNFFKNFDYQDDHNSKSLYPIENKKFYNILLRDIQKINEYITLNHREDVLAEKKTRKENKSDVV